MAEDEGRLSFVAGMDDGDFVRGATNIRETIHETAKDVKQTGLTVAEFTGQMQKLLGSFDRMTAAVDRNTNAQEQAAKSGQKAADAEKQGADKATRAIDETGKATDELGRKLRQTGDEGSASFDKLTKYAAGFFTIQKASELGRKIFDVRQEMEKLQVSFKTLAGTDFGQELYEDIKDFTLHTPMMMNDLAKGAQTMLGFNIEAKKVMPILRQIGDISMGDSQKFNSLTLAFSQMSSTGKLMGQDLLQMINAGFNPLVVISEKTGKSIANLKEEMSKGLITVEMVEDAFRTATDEGGKFHGMLEQQSKTIGGAYSNLQGAISEMFNSLGEKSEGVMMGAIDTATSLAQNYEKVGRVIMGLVGTYGVYKTAVMVVTALESFRTKNLALQAVGIQGVTAAEAIHYHWLVLTQKAQELLNATMLTNPYVAVAVAIASVTAAFISLGSEQDRVNAAYDEYMRKKDEVIRNEKEHTDAINELIRVAGDESLSTDTRRNAIFRLKAEYPDLFQKYKTEIEALKDIAYWKAKIAEIETGKSIQLAGNELNSVNNRISELEKKGKWSIASTNSYAGTHTSSRTRTEEEELKALLKRREELTTQIKKESDTNYLKDLTGISNDDLQKQINERKNLIARIEMKEKEGKKNLKGRTLQGGVTGIYDKSELKDQLQTLEWEQNRRNEIITNSSKDFVSEATKAYNKESKALKALQSLTDPKKRSKSTQKIDGKKVSEMSGDEFLAAVQKQQQAVDEAKKKVDAYNKAKNGGTTPKKTNDNEAKQQAKAKAQEIQEEQRHQEELSKIRRQAEDARTDATIAAITNDSERERAEQDEQHKRNLRQIEDQADEMKKAVYEHNKRVWENSHKDSPYELTEEGKKGWKSISLSSEQMEIIKAQTDKENAEYKRLIEERYRNEAQCMLDFLKQYGSIEQQRYAITKEFDEKIAKERNEYRKKALEEEKKDTIAQLNARELAENIDWSQTFEGLGNVLKGIAKETLKEIDEYMSTADFKSLSAESKKAYRDLRNQLVESGGRESSNPFSSSTWNEIGRLANEYRDSVKRVRIATENHKDAVDKVSKAEEKLRKATSAEAVDIANLELDKAKQWADETKNALENEKESQERTRTNLHETTEKANQGLQDFNTVLGQITSGSLTGFTLAVGNLINKIGGSTEKAATEIGELFGETGKKIGGIISSILAVIDTLGEDPQGFVDDMLNKVADVIEVIVAKLPEILMSAIKGIGNIVTSVFSGIGEMFGFGGKSNHDKMLERQEQYTRAIDSTTRALNKMSEQLEKSYGILAIENASKAEEIIRENMKAIVNGINSVLEDNYSGGHSDYYHANKSQGVLQQLQDIGKNYGVNALDGEQGKYTWQQLLQNDPQKLAEMFKDISESNSDLWRIITTEIGYNDGALADWLEKLIDAYEQIGENTEKLKEQITGTTFDNVFDSFMDSLYDLADDSEDVFDDVAENWQQMMNKMVLNNTLGDEYRDKLRRWYEQWSEIYNDKNIDASELESLRNSYNEIVKAAQEEVNALKEQGIISSTAEAKADKDATNVIADKATYDQFEKYLGIATAQQIAQEQIKGILDGWDKAGISPKVSVSPAVDIENNVPRVEVPTMESPVVNVERDNKEAQLILSNLQAMRDIASSNGTVFMEIRNLVGISNEYLLSIRNSNSSILSTMTVKMEELYNLMEKKL